MIMRLAEPRPRADPLRVPSESTETTLMRPSTSLVVSCFALSLSAACSSTSGSSSASAESKPATASAPAAHGVLDGKVFEVQLVDASGKKDVDQLVFDAA